VGIAHGIGQMALQWARGDRPVSSDDRLSAPPEGQG
jgi:hypothetical protein